jgi:hypothetical protein
MTRPLRSTPITGASPLLRAGPPARCQHAAARLPMFHARAADQAHAASVPDTTWPVIGHPPGPAPAARSMATVSMPLRERNDTSTAVRVHSSSWSPPGTPPVPFPHRSPRRSSANAACGGLEPPPEGRLRRAYLHLSHSTDSRRLTYLIKTSVRRSWRTPRRPCLMFDSSNSGRHACTTLVRNSNGASHSGPVARPSRLAQREARPPCRKKSRSASVGAMAAARW